MKLCILQPEVGTSRRRAGFTLAEFQISILIVLMIVCGLLATHMYGLRMFELIKPKLNALDQARATTAKLTEEIRAAHLIRIGSGSADRFTEVGPNQTQAGSALQIYPTAATNVFIRYYWSGDGCKLMRTTNDAEVPMVLAHCVSNEIVFTSEDFAGNVLASSQNNRVIGLTLQFYQIQYPATAIGPGNLYDFYQLRTKITRRTLF